MVDLAHNTIFRFSESTNPQACTDLTGINLNTSPDRLIANDLALKTAVDTLEVSSNSRALPAPLNQNGFLINGLVDGPVGYSGAGNCVVTAVSAYTKGFQGTYRSPSNAATTQDEATASKPFYYGSYSTGPRTLYGGLGGGHNTPSNSHRPLGSGTTNVDQTDASKEGCILKLHKPTGGQNHRNNACLVTMKYYCNTRKVRFRAYVWVDSGPLNFKFGPLNGSETISVPNLKVWTPVDIVINTRGSTGKYWRIILDTESLQTIYIGMLGIYPVAGSGDSASSLNV